MSARPGRAARRPSPDPPAHRHRGHRNGDDPGDTENFAAGGDAGEFGGGGAHVRDEQRGDGQHSGAGAVPLADQSGQPLPGDHADPGAEVLEEHQRDGRDGQYPQEGVAVVGAQYRVGGDPGGVVVRQPRQQTGADHRGQPRQPGEPGPPRTLRGGHDEGPIQRCRGHRRSSRRVSASITSSARIRPIGRSCSSTTTIEDPRLSVIVDTTSRSPAPGGTVTGHGGPTSSATGRPGSTPSSSNTVTSSSSRPSWSTTTSPAP